MIAPNFSYNELIEKIIKLPLEYKLEIKDIIEKNIIETRREEIEKNYQKSLKEEKNNELEFSSKISQLKKIL